ncbi:hypothetical protein TI39_contig287g00026 [Zymoseptoria brevis]|uniref:Uncharacterized protein n=1 Tax=Zymoseptoria brevis TaxID=1047168 RepID=A0A0F4GWE1_9PEZI|nr:hypothetical protein TI39_contig287g00026 [Zymoseptoria brevis]
MAPPKLIVTSVNCDDAGRPPASERAPRIMADNEINMAEDSSDSGTTPKDLTSPAISPPDSQPRNASGSSIANSNGKRPIQTIMNGMDDQEELAAMVNSKARQEFPTRTHKETGYSWSRAEDEPGHTWTNKKAHDEYNRAWDNMVHKDNAIRNKYGDPFKLVENERATAASLQQQ